MSFLLKSICFAGLFALLCTIPAGAQIDNEVTFNSPFAFYAGNAELPAGTYTVTQPDDSDHVLQIQSADGSRSVLVEFDPVDSNAPSSKTEITFNKYGTVEFISGISVQGQDSSMQIFQTKAEKNAAKTAAAASHALSSVSGN
jgi:hypothetical protein